MSDAYGNDFFSVTDDDGNKFELEHLDTLELGGELYMAFLPADMDEKDEDYGVVILKVLEEDGEESFVTVDDDDELERVYERFMERLFEDGDGEEA
ncbi:MAG: DUF1292 domain-containing protein [Oscillospiraceae bacterium]|jgi:uncharacterized protein YrzB (UPF0473 family)|nr:DUF1292 domain-containing protein [Oscillospiraceae bacterium]